VQALPEGEGCVLTGLNRSLWWLSPGAGRRVWTAMASAASGRSVRRWSAMPHPTTLRLKASRTTAT